MCLKNVFRGILLLFIFSACVKDDDGGMPEPDPSPPVSPVNFEEELLPYEKLSDYNFFSGAMADHTPVHGVVPYELISPLFTDYAHKKRFVWMREGASARYASDGEILNFDDGSVLIKTFYYDQVMPDNDRRIIETRLLYKVGGEWYFAEYVWNDEQTEAFLDMDGSFTQVAFTDEHGTLRDVNYRIPSEAECLTCHKTLSQAVPIGPKPQNINKPLSYESGILNQLEKWRQVGYLTGNVPTEINTTVAWDDPTALLLDRVRSYLDINCAHCHKDESHCDYRPMRFAYEETTIPENLGICVPPDEILDPVISNIITPSNIDRSMIHFRMNSTDPANRMPLLGRSIVHDEGVELIVEYINSLEGPC
jgi:uncharacterized repeat protein (TIGR03806 family)